MRRTLIALAACLMLAVASPAFATQPADPPSSINGGSIAEPTHCQDHYYTMAGDWSTCVSLFTRLNANGLEARALVVTSRPGNSNCNAWTESEGGAYSPITVSSQTSQTIKHTSCSSTRYLSVFGPSGRKMYVQVKIHVRVNNLPDKDLTFKFYTCSGNQNNGYSGTSTC